MGFYSAHCLGPYSLAGLASKTGLVGKKEVKRENVVKLRKLLGCYWGHHFARQILKNCFPASYLESFETICLAALLLMSLRASIHKNQF